MKKKFISILLGIVAFASVANAQVYPFDTNLSVGSEGPDVVALQTWLIDNGYYIPAIESYAVSKGYFGVQTRSALVKYQKDVKLPASGYFGPLTRASIAAGEGSAILKGTFQTGEVRALFVTTLASRITSSATSMTLTSATDKDGNTLASSTYGFVIDEGLSTEEFVLADCTSTTCTNMSRGVSVTTGTSTVLSLAHEHRRGAEVKITDAPALIFGINVFKGKQNLENTLKYNSHPTFVLNTELVDKKYVDDTAFSGAGVIDASVSARGVVEIATGIETASSTSNGGAGILVPAASNATSTYNSATAPLKIVVTQNSGKIDDNFISTSTLFSRVSFATTTATSTNIGAFPAYWIGKNRQVITTTGTSTFTVPSGINKLHVVLCGAGGGGGASGANAPSAGGGAGGCADKMLDVTGTTTITVFVGSGGSAGSSSNGGNGTWTTFGVNGSFFYCYGGVGGGSGTGGAAGTGGTCSGGDINITGQQGAAGGVAGGSGASSAFGLGIGQSPAASGGLNGTGYGSSGSGSGNTSNNGGAGAQGIIIITW